MRKFIPIGTVIRSLLLATSLILNHTIKAQYQPLEGFAGGLTVATNGVGGELNFLLAPTSHIKNQKLALSFQTTKHSRETKVQNNRYLNPKPYVYGKLNAAATLRLSYSISRQIGRDKPNKPSVFVGLQAGPNLGILKPYYIGYDDNSEESTGPSIIIQNDETMGNQDSIYGPANWTIGLDELSFTPGIHISTQITINWNHSFYFQRWETGIRFDYFPRELEILHLANNKAFTSIYSSYIIGKRRP